MSLGPEAYVSPELEKTQYFAWARRLSTHTYIYIYLLIYFLIFQFLSKVYLPKHITLHWDHNSNFTFVQP